MNIMALDAEFNQPSRKVIQIGAAVYNARTAALIDRLEINVNPYEPISQEIIELTGITDKDVENGPGILDAYYMLMMFCQKHKCFRNPLVWGSGVRNDSIAIYEDAKSQRARLDEKLGVYTGPFNDNFMGFRVLDVKTIYQSMMIFKGGQHSGGLTDSMERLGLKFEGDPHRALTDAMNTFRTWHCLMVTMRDGYNNKS